MVPKVRNLRTSGSAALHLAYVAAGSLAASGNTASTPGIWPPASCLSRKQAAV